MPDPYIQLPQDDESPDAVLADLKAFLQTAIPGWEPSDAAPEVALGSAFSDEASTLYTLLREDADDKYRDFGATVLGVAAVQPVPAATTTTWTARTAAGVGGLTIEAGTPLVITGPTGSFAFEVVADAVIAEAATVATGVLIRALDAGTSANLADGTVEFDTPPAWVLTVTVDAPATGGTDGDTDEDYQSKVVRTAGLLSRAPILPADFEAVAQEQPEVARALVRNLYDESTGLDNQERTVSIYPVQEDGTACTSGTKAAIIATVNARRELNWVTRAGDPTYTTVGGAITVAARDGYDRTDLQARVIAAIAEGPTNPAMFGQPPLGERRTWLLRTFVRRYEIAATADLVDGVDYVVSVTLTGANVDGDVPLAGTAPLPLPGTFVVTVVDAA